MIEIKLNTQYPMSTTIETLKRIGVANREQKIIYPTAYIIEYDGRYFIAHFKELFKLTRGRDGELSNEDIGRVNSVAHCLVQWGIIDSIISELSSLSNFVFVLKRDRMVNEGWTVSHKFNMLEFKIWKEGRNSEN